MTKSISNSGRQMIIEFNLLSPKYTISSTRVIFSFFT
jgi:hypothetical protein